MKKKPQSFLGFCKFEILQLNIRKLFLNKNLSTWGAQEFFRERFLRVSEDPKSSLKIWENSKDKSSNPDSSLPSLKYKKNRNACFAWEPKNYLKSLRDSSLYLLPTSGSSLEIQIEVCKYSNLYNYIHNLKMMGATEVLLKNWGVQLHPLHPSNIVPERLMKREEIFTLGWTMAHFQPDDNVLKWQNNKKIEIDTQESCFNFWVPFQSNLNT